MTRAVALVLRLVLGPALAVAAAAPLSAQTARNDPKTETAHVVQPGETLGGIANRAEVPRILIIEANGLKAPYALRAGQTLIIPRRRTHTVKAGESGFDVAMLYGVPWSAIAAANGIKPDSALKAGSTLSIPTATARTAAAQPSISTDPPPGLPDTAAPAFVWPVRGKVRRGFIAAATAGSGHDGIDVLAPQGTAVRAAAAGKVIFAGPGPDEYGLTVIVWHAGRWTTTYSYLDKITVKIGERVKAGERIGLVGETGLAEEPQLHFEVRRNKMPQDPARYLPKTAR